MPECIHEEKAGDWTGHVWRRNEAANKETDYFWSLSYGGDIHAAANKSPDGGKCPPNLIPDSGLYNSEAEAKVALLDEIKRKTG